MGSKNAETHIYMHVYVKQRVTSELRCVLLRSECAVWRNISGIRMLGKAPGWRKIGSDKKGHYV